MPDNAVAGLGDSNIYFFYYSDDDSTVHCSCKDASDATAGYSDSQVQDPDNASITATSEYHGLAAATWSISSVVIFTLL